MSEVSHLDQLKEQHAMFCTQRDQAHANLQQVLGAIYACELMISKLGESSDVKADEPKTEEAT